MVWLISGAAMGAMCWCVMWLCKDAKEAIREQETYKGIEVEIRLSVPESMENDEALRRVMRAIDNCSGNITAYSGQVDNYIVPLPAMMELGWDEDQDKTPMDPGASFEINEELDG